MVIKQYESEQSVLEQLDTSSCFGIAHSPNAPECQVCDLADECWAKSVGNNLNVSAKMLNPETEAELKKAKTHYRKKYTKVAAKPKAKTAPAETPAPAKPAKQTKQPQPQPDTPEDRAAQAEGYYSARAKRRALRKEVTAKIGMKTTKKLTTEELWNYLEDVGGECKRYDTDSVQRVQLAMAIKAKLVEQYNTDHPNDRIEYPLK